MQQLTLDTTYETYNAFAKRHGRTTEKGSLIIKGGTVNLYVSNAEVKPASAAAMQLDQSSPLGEGTETITGIVKWILIESAAGSPVVTEEYAVGTA